MNPELAKMLESKPALYPHQLEKDFPHIPAEIAQRWNTPEIESYFHDLMLDTRGDRDGFSEAVMREIFALFKHWQSLQPPKPRSIDNWADSIS